MDQNPNPVGGADVNNMTANDPSQDMQFFNEAAAPTASSNMPAMGQPEISAAPAMGVADPTQPTMTADFQSVAPATSEPTPVAGQPATPIEMGSQPAAPAPETPILRPVDSNYIERDLRLAGDKKPKTALIIGSIAGAVALVVACFAIWFFAVYSNPKKVVFDGVSNLLRAKNVALQGGASITLRDKNSSNFFQSVTVNFNSASAKLPNSTDVSITVALDESKKVNLQLGTVQMSDGIIYIKVSGIMDSLRSLGLDPETRSGMEDLISAVETVDGEWWRISVRDVVREMTGGQDEDIVNIVGDFYDCTLRASTRDNSKEILDLLKQHPFVDVTPVEKITIDSSNPSVSDQPVAWHKFYEVKFKSAELASFINALPHTSAANEVYACYNTAIQAYDAKMSASMGSYGAASASKQISADDFEEISADDIKIDEKLHIFVEAAQFGHRIRSVLAYVEDDVWNNSASVSFTYQDATVAAPSEYRNITELFKELPIEDAWSSFSLSGLGGYGTTCYGTTDLPTDCLEPYSAPIYYDESDDAEFDDFDLRVRTNETEAI